MITLEINPHFVVHPDSLKNIVENIITTIDNNIVQQKTLIPEEIENIKNTNNNFFCNICQTTSKYGKILHCKHMFCNKCIEKWLLYNSNTCPTCRNILN